MMRTQFDSIFLASAYIMIVLSTSAYAKSSFLNTLNIQNFNLVASGLPVGGNGAEGNPYGMAVAQTSTGRIKQGNILLTNWNDANGNPGQGKTIVQLNPKNGQTSVFTTINTVPAGCGTNIGLTMALVTFPNGFVFVGSTPISTANNPNHIAQNGCLIMLDDQGRIATQPDGKTLFVLSGAQLGVAGPWGAGVQKIDNNNFYVYVSMVLGADPATATQVNQGAIMRYQLNFKNRNVQLIGATQIVNDIPTTPAGIGGGTVGPAGIVYSANGDNRLYFSNTLNDSVDSILAPQACASPATCRMDTVAFSGFIKMPIGMNPAPNGNLLLANGGNGNLVEIAPFTAPWANVQVAFKLVDSSFNNGGAPGAGNLFNLLVFNKVLFFNDDNLNNIQTLTTGTMSGRKLKL